MARKPVAEETRLKLSLSLVGHAVSDETRRKISEANSGRIRTPETRAKMSASHTGKKRSPEIGAKISASLKGQKRGPLSDETRQKMSAALKGRKRGPLSDETKAKISAARKGKKLDLSLRKSRGPLSEETRAKMSASARRGPDHPRWGKPPSHIKRIEHKGHVFRSSYEVRCADALDRKGIKWEYEPRRFDLGDCTYLPDFYLPEHGVYWEVKGWLDPRSQRKINRFREVHHDVPLVVVTNAVLNLLEK